MSFLVVINAVGNQTSHAQTTMLGPGNQPDLSGRFLVYECAQDPASPDFSHGNAAICLHDIDAGTTDEIAAEGTGEDFEDPAVSSDGRFVAYKVDDGSGIDQIFLVDRDSGGTPVLLTAASDGTPGDDDTTYFDLVTDPTHPDEIAIVFYSRASNLVEGDNNGVTDAFLWRRVSGTIERVSLADDGSEADTGISSGGESGGMGPPGVTAHRCAGDACVSVDQANALVVFDASQYESTLVPNDFNGEADVFLRDRIAGTTTRLSENASGTGGDCASHSPAISQDGRVVAFFSCAGNLGLGTLSDEVVVLELESGAFSSATVTVDGSEPDGDSVWNEVPVLSERGRFVLFDSKASNLVPDDTNGTDHDVFIRDRLAERTELVSIDASGEQVPGANEQTMTEDGRWVAWEATVQQPDGPYLPMLWLRDRGDVEGPLVGIVEPTTAVTLGDAFQLIADADDTGRGDLDIASAEYRVEDGSWLPMDAEDGAFDEITERVVATLDSNVLGEGVHRTCVRAFDSAGNAELPACIDIVVEPPDATVRLRAIEVNQAIQDWRNSIPLYHDKPTVARVFLERADDSAPTSATGRLHGSVGGSPLPGSPLDPEQSLVSLLDDASVLDDPETRGGAIEGARARIDGSLNFVLPPSWTDPTTDPVVLEFERTQAGANVLGCAEPDGTPDCAVEVSFSDVSRPLLAMVAVPYNRNEVRILEVTATGGTYRFTSQGRRSDAVSFDAGSDVVDDAVEDVLNARNGRVRVSCTRNCDTDDLNPRFRITVMRGQAEELAVDDSGLTGSIEGSGPSANLDLAQEGGPEIRPDDDHLQEQARRIADNFPISSIDRRLTDINGFNRAPTVIKVNTRLQKVRSLGLIFGDYQREAKSFGYLLGSDFPESTRSGQGWVRVASAYSVDLEAPRSGGKFRNLVAHETAHTYGRAHAVTRRVVGLGSVGVCGAKGHIHLPVLHPWVEETGWRNDDTTDFYSDTSWPTIGPLSNGPDEEVWGFSPRAYLNGRGFEDLVVVDPWRSAALMSYCDGVGTRQDTWVSALTYDILAQRLHGTSTRNAGANRGTVASGDFVLVAGTVDPVTGEATLDPVIRATGADPGFDTGPVHVALVNDSGVKLSARDVALLEDGNDESLSYGTGPLVPGFFAALPVPAGSVPSGVEVSMNGDVIGTLVASSNPPTVTLSSPLGGETVAGTIPISWTADDWDADPLVTTVLYSIDGGVTWEALAVDIEGTSYEAPTRFLRGSTQALVRVQVSDGFHTAEDTSGPFTVDAGKPRAMIASPAGERSVACQVLRLVSDSWDPEEGELQGTSLAWQSDLDGPLGTGRVLWLDTSLLRKGTHLVTLTASDGDGRTDTDRVSIRVRSSGCEDTMFADGFEPL